LNCSSHKMTHFIKFQKFPRKMIQTGCETPCREQCRRYWIICEMSSSKMKTLLLLLAMVWSD
jgi:hypothetical protein